MDKFIQLVGDLNLDVCIDGDDLKEHFNLETLRNSPDYIIFTEHNYQFCIKDKYINNLFV